MMPGPERGRTLTLQRLKHALVLLPIVATACGGIAVFDDGSGGAGASTTSATTTSSTKSTATSSKAASTKAASTVATTTSAITTGGAFCDEHSDCGVLNLCRFITGQCAPACGPGAPPCPPNLACLPCGTSSCPGCEDCLEICGETF